MTPGAAASSVLLGWKPRKELIFGATKPAGGERIVTAGGALTLTRATVGAAAFATGDVEDAAGAAADDVLTVGLTVTGAAAEDVLDIAEIAAGTAPEAVAVDGATLGSAVAAMVLASAAPGVVEACSADEESSVSGDTIMGSARADERLRGFTATVERARVELLMTWTVDELGIRNGHLVIGLDVEATGKRSRMDGLLTVGPWRAVSRGGS